MNDYLSPLWISLKTVLVTTAITFVLGIAAARWMSRYTGKIKPLIDGIFILPLVLPPTVAGFGLLLFMGKHGWGGKFLALFNTSIVFSWPATVIAAAVMSFPLMYMTTKGAFEQVDTNIEDAARTLGAGEWRVLYSVTLPMAIYFAIVDGNMKQANILMIIVLCIALASLALLAYLKKPKPRERGLIANPVPSDILHAGRKIDSPP